ncbi:MAG: amidophosphoribosyltransferase [Candidatus Delongbacteria bacterium]|jgi:amidophosphoribosyltransferase|nr:amidophosphoribosyltransferase [Candidatus Delongbacteria bacterium]
MCGVVGVFNSEAAAFDTMLGLFAIQNRGQESCGLAVSNGNQIKLMRGLGLVKDNFTEKKLRNYPGKIAVGHVRYPTRGTSDINNSQPHVIETLEGTIFALASNGDITNYKTLTDELQKKKVNFNSGNDGELILRFIVWNHIVKGHSVVDSIKMVMQKFKGAFSTVLMGRNEMWAFRDPYGVRPFSFGKTESGYAFSSESKGLDILRATDIEEVKPGEIIHVYEDNQIERINFNSLELRNGRKGCAHCVFEPVYFSMPDSNQYGLSVYEARKAMGKALASYDEDLEIDVVVAVPDSSNVQALGYAQTRNIPFEIGLIRNHYVGRTFIKPDQRVRDESVKQKFNPVVSTLKGKRVILVDDSIVRGTTMRKIAGMLWNSGVKEIHLRIASPPVKYPCFYGLDTPTKEELLANKMELEDMPKYLRVNSVRYLDQKDLSNCVNNKDDNFCFACFDGNYPIELVDVSF